MAGASWLAQLEKRIDKKQKENRGIVFHQWRQLFGRKGTKFDAEQAMFLLDWLVNI